MTASRSSTKRLNVRYLLVTLAVLTLLGLGVLGLKAFQGRHVRDNALTQIRALIEEGHGGQALQHLDQYLNMAPNDVEALEIQAELLAAAASSPAQLLQAAQVNDRLLRLDPDGPDRDVIRRRLVRLYVLYSDLSRSSSLFQNAPELVAGELRYRAAEAIARQLVVKSPQDPEAHRLLGMALEGMAAPDNPQTVAEVVAEYEAALKLDPGDLQAAERLARLLVESGQDPAAAERVLDALLAARPDDPQARLIRYRHFQRLRRLELAAAEIEAATRLAPDDLVVRLTAAQDALQRGDPAAARHHLADLAPEQRGDLRVRMLNGLIDFSEERPEDAVEEWRQGLFATQGTSADLTWWLAYSLLRMGRLSEADSLLTQYLRLVGGNPDDPRLKLLEALKAEVAGRPAEAVEILEAIQTKLGRSLQEKLYMALGRCQLALEDRPKAIEAFRQAIRFAEAGSALPRLTLAGVLMQEQGGDPDAAIVTIEEGLDSSPDEPELLIALAGARLSRQTALPAAQRRWAAFDAALARAAKAAPNSAAVVLMRANRLALDNQLEPAVALLKPATDHNPRDTRLWIALAETLNRLDRADEALACLERATAPEAAGDVALIRIARANLLLADGRGREARDLLSRDLEHLSSDQRPLVLQALGQLAANQGDVEAARHAYDAWARLQPDDPRPIARALDLALNLGDQPRIAALLEALRRISGDDDPIYLSAQADVILRTDPDHPERARSVLEQLLARDPKRPIAHLLRGRVLERQGQTDDALAAYRLAWEGGVTSAYTPLAALLARTKHYDELMALQQTDRAFQLGGLAALASWQAGDRDQAARFVALAVKARPEGLDVGNWQAHLLDSLGRAGDAEAALRTRIEARPGETEPWVTLIRFLADHGRLDDARQTAASARRRIPTDRPELLEAQCLMALRDWVATDKTLETALQRWPDDPKVQIAAAQYYQETGRPARSVEHLTRAHQLDPNDRNVARELAVQLSGLAASDPGAWDQAWALVGPDVPNADAPEDRLARAVVMARDPHSDRSSEAITTLETLLADLPPDRPTAAAARDYLVRILLALGRAETAVQVAAVSAESGSNPDAVLLYAEVLIRARRFAQAEAQLDRIALVLPGDRREARLRALLIRDRAGEANAPTALVQAVADAGRSPQAEPLGFAAYQMLLPMGPAGLEAADQIGRLLAEARPALAWMPAEVAARRSRPDDALALCTQAIAAAEGENLEQAARVAATTASAADASPEVVRRGEAILQTALGRDPRSPVLLLLTALFHHQQGHYEQEIALYRQILASRPDGDPDGDKVLNNLAWALSEGLNRPDEALKTIEPVITRHPREPQFLATRGVILVHLQQYDRAIADLEAAVATEASPVRLYHLARAYRAAGQDAKFREQLQKARQAGLTLDMADPTERGELASLLQL